MEDTGQADAMAKATDQQPGVQQQTAEQKVTLQEAAGRSKAWSAKIAATAPVKTPIQITLEPVTADRIAVKQPEIRSTQPETDLIKIKDPAALNNGQPVKDIALAVAAPEEEADANLVSFASNDKPENVFLTNIPVDNNVPLRSFLRKASRVISKVTAIKHTNRAGFTIGNVEIAIQ